MNTFASSFIFGIPIAISVGTIAMLIINRSINCGLLIDILSGTAAAFAELTYGVISFTAGSAIYAMLMAYEGWLQMLASAVLILFGGWMFLNAVKTSSSVATALDASFKGVFVLTYALTIANRLIIVAFTGFAAQSAISGFSTILLGSAALFAGSFLIQLTLAFLEVH